MPRGQEPADTLVNHLQLSDETSNDGRRRVVVLAGELDMATAGLLEAKVADVLADDLDEFVLDMSAVTFTDSVGLRAMLRARRACEQHGTEFFLVPARGGEQHRLLQLSGVVDEFTFRPPLQADPGEERGAEAL